MSLALRAALLAVFTATLHAAAPPAPADPATVTRLLRKLDAESFQTRQRADEALRGLGKSVLPRLKEELTHNRSLEVRSRLERIVHDLTFDERVPELVRMLGHDNTQFRDQAEWALRKGGPAAVPLLRLESKQPLDSDGRRRLDRIIAELSLPRR